MDTELMENNKVIVNIDISGLAAFGITAITVAGFCFCFYTSIRNNCTIQFGTFSLSPRQSIAPLTA
ncbi:MAG: hypothetical protein Q4P20_03255 [Eubacteriales bacterium]|nr:hypothetical protein [Eubacteriales bacterium]